MSARPLSRLTLVLGGARSGKSAYAERLMTSAPAPWLYLATAQAIDEEMQARIADHKGRRDARWRTLEAPLDLPEALAGLGERPQAVLIDCLTLWLSNALLAKRNLAREGDRLVAALSAAPGPVIAVSNEVGLGIVPDTSLGREFRDAQGQLNQRIAALSDNVVFLAAGLPLTLK